MEVRVNYDCFQRGAQDLKKFRLTAALLFIAARCIAAESANDLAGVPSPYTQVVLGLINGFVKKGSTVVFPQIKSPVFLQCWETPGNDLYIGVEQRMSIEAPFAQVRAVIDDIDHYQQLFPGYQDIHVESRASNLLETYWEQRIPVFFVPNAKYEMIYQVDTSDPNRAIYRYQLKKPASLKMSDGFVLISKEGENKTRYVEYDFFDAVWGAAKIFGGTKIWHDTIEGVALSDLAIKLKAENPTWSDEKARSDSSHLLQNGWVDDCVKGRKPFAVSAP